MDPQPLTYTFYDEVAEIEPREWFSLRLLPHHFVCHAELSLSPGDKVKVFITKVTNNVKQDNRTGSGRIPSAE